MSKRLNATNQHTHNLSDGQLICDNEQCREQVRDKIEEINNEIKHDFNRIVEKYSKDKNINNDQGWSVMCLTSRKLSDRLISLFNKDEIHQVIQQYIERNNTRQAFDKAFEFEKNQKSDELITKEQLWNIYMKMCQDAVKVLSKAKKERGTHIANFLVFDEN